jgi:hypothetical protein
VPDFSEPLVHQVVSSTRRERLACRSRAFIVFVPVDVDEVGLVVLLDVVVGLVDQVVVHSKCGAVLLNGNGVFSIEPEPLPHLLPHGRLYSEPKASPSLRALALVLDLVEEKVFVTPGTHTLCTVARLADVQEDHVAVDSTLLELLGGLPLVFLTRDPRPALVEVLLDRPWPGTVVRQHLSTRGTRPNRQLLRENARRL